MPTVALYAGRVRPLPESGRATGIYKEPVTFPLHIGVEGLAGDLQADRRVHGGPDKAVHLFPAAHYATLAARFPDRAERFVPGSMGENLSTAELTEADVRVGEIWRLGEVRLQLCQPRNPCGKIDERYGCEGVARFIAEQAIAGWYWRVPTPGTVTATDSLKREAQADAPTLREALTLLAAHRPSVDALERLARCTGIADNWRDAIRRRMVWLQANA